MGLILLASCSRPTETAPEGLGAPPPPPAAASASAAAIAPEPASVASEAAPPAEAGAPDARGDDGRKGQLVVHIGDSFTEASFEQNLRGRFGAVGTKYWVNSQNASYTTTWGYSDKLDGMLWGHPALVLITLGANELAMAKPESHLGAIREIVKKVTKWSGSCVWITPPLWKKDTGIIALIRDNSAPCLFFDSDLHAPNIERQKDNIHPNDVGGAKWSAAFWAWLEAHRDPARGGWALRAEPP